MENAIVLSRDAVLNPPLRFADEFVRHKVLDFDRRLALIGKQILGSVVADRAGHAHAHRFGVAYPARQVVLGRNNLGRNHGRDADSRRGQPQPLNRTSIRGTTLGIHLQMPNVRE